jgi:biopolymer transport protein TolQ
MPSPAHVAPSGVFDLLSEAGLMAKLVLLVLASSSVMCWAIIVTKWKTLKVVRQQNEVFISTFWNGKDIDEIVSKSDHFPRSPIASVFVNGVKELRKLSAIIPDATSTVGNERMDNIYRALNRASTNEISTLEKHISWLATTASAAPFLGLFGTVWGIMNSFQSIGASGAASLAVVAPGISEALITTATGIGVAIPAVIAYNYFVGQIKKVATEMECFSQDFINIIQRSFLGGKKGNE